MPVNTQELMKEHEALKLKLMATERKLAEAEKVVDIAEEAFSRLISGGEYSEAFNKALSDYKAVID